MEQTTKVSIKEKLNEAFKELRSQGMFARQNFLCCQSCASYALWNEDKSKKKAVAAGYVFYHNQDKDALDLFTGELKQTRRWDGEKTVRGTAKLYLAFGGGHPEGATKLSREKAIAAVGRKIQQALEDAGLQVEWDGTGSTRIAVVGHRTGIAFGDYVMVKPEAIKDHDAGRYAGKVGKCLMDEDNGFVNVFWEACWTSMWRVSELQRVTKPEGK